MALSASPWNAIFSKRILRKSYRTRSQIYVGTRNWTLISARNCNVQQNTNRIVKQLLEPRKPNET